MRRRDGTRDAMRLNKQAQQLVTRIYFPDEEDANAQDPVLASIEDRDAAATLVAHAVDGGLRFDIRLQGEGETCFFAV